MRIEKVFPATYVDEDEYNDKSKNAETYTNRVLKIARY
jgi:hypothetical protein